MGRIRTIKPEFPLSESVGRLSREARLLFIQLWTICDDSGRTRAASRILASLLYPFDEDAPSLIDGWLEELDKEGMVRLYTAEGTTYLEVCNWLRHQKIDKPSQSRLPAFVESSRILANPREASMMDLGPRTVDQGPRTEDLGPEQHCRAGARPDGSDDPLFLPLEALQEPGSHNHTTQPVKTRQIERAAASRRILEKLNSASGRSFEPVPANLTLIEARLADCKDDEDGVAAMIVRQCLLWAGTEMAQYLRPATLFSRTKFRAYYDDRNQPVTAGPGNRPAGGQSRSHRNEYIGDEASRASWARQAAARIDETVEGFAPGVG